MPLLDVPFRGQEAQYKDLIATVMQLHTDMQRVLRRMPDRAGEKGPPQLPGGEIGSDTGLAELYVVTLGSNVTRGSTVNCTITAAIAGDASGTISVTEAGCLKTGDTVASSSTAIAGGSSSGGYRFLVFDCDEIS